MNASFLLLLTIISTMILGLLLLLFITPNALANLVGTLSASNRGATNFDILRLPSELRLIVYECAFGGNLILTAMADTSWASLSNYDWTEGWHRNCRAATSALGMTSRLLRGEIWALQYEHDILHFDHPADLMRVAARLQLDHTHLTVKTVAISSKFPFYEDLAQDDPNDRLEWKNWCDIIEEYHLRKLFPELKLAYIQEGGYLTSQSQGKSLGQKMQDVLKMAKADSEAERGLRVIFCKFIARREETDISIVVGVDVEI